MLIAIIQRDSGDRIDMSTASAKTADSRGADAAIFRGFDNRYSDVKKIFESLDDSRIKKIVNSLPDNRWLGINPDGFHFNRHNIRIALERPEITDILKERELFNGASVHNSEELDRAVQLHEKLPLSYLLISPVFKPSYDQGADALGVEGFRKLYTRMIHKCRNSDSRPKAVALGGVNGDTIGELLSYSFIEGVAAMSAIRDHGLSEFSGC